MRLYINSLIPFKDKKSKARVFLYLILAFLLTVVFILDITIMYALLEYICSSETFVYGGIRFCPEPVHVWHARVITMPLEKFYERGYHHNWLLELLDTLWNKITNGHLFLWNDNLHLLEHRFDSEGNHKTADVICGVKKILIETDFMELYSKSGSFVYSWPFIWYTLFLILISFCILKELFNIKPSTGIFVYIKSTSEAINMFLGIYELFKWGLWLLELLLEIIQLTPLAFFYGFVLFIHSFLDIDVIYFIYTHVSPELYWFFKPLIYNYFMLSISNTDHSFCITIAIINTFVPLLKQYFIYYSLIRVIVFLNVKFGFNIKIKEYYIKYLDFFL